MLLSFCALLACLAATASAQAAPPTPADLVWARKMLHRRRHLVRRAGPTILVKPQGTIINSDFNDCGVYGDTSYHFSDRTIEPVPDYGYDCAKHGLERC